MVSAANDAFRQTVRVVAVLNLLYFGVEFAVAARIGSVSLFADSVDFLEDAAINGLILAALAWRPALRARVGMGLAGMILVPGLATLWTAWQQFHLQTVPEPLPLSVTGAGAFAVNFVCALLLVRHRHHGGSLSKAAFLSARNDVFGNIAIVAAGLLTARFPSPWPDLVVGLAIAALNADAAREVWEAARAEHRDAVP